MRSDGFFLMSAGFVIGLGVGIYNAIDVLQRGANRDNFPAAVVGLSVAGLILGFALMSRMPPSDTWKDGDPKHRR